MIHYTLIIISWSIVLALTILELIDRLQTTTPKQKHQNQNFQTESKQSNFIMRHCASSKNAQVSFVEILLVISNHAVNNQF